MTARAPATASVAGRVAAGSAQMQLEGILRQRGTDLYLEQLLPQESGHAAGWTTPRLYRLLATPATQTAIHEHVDHRVTATGSPSYSEARHRMFVVLDSVEPLDVDPGTRGRLCPHPTRATAHRHLTDDAAQPVDDDTETNCDDRDGS
jgi:hypothetical protein